MGTQKKIQSPGDALLAEFEARIRSFDSWQRASFNNHLVGGLTEAMANMPGGPERYIQCLDRAAEYAKEAWS